MTKTQIQIEEAIRRELSNVQAVQNIKPHEQIILQNMVHRHYGSIHPDFIYPKESYNLEENETEFLKGINFKLGIIHSCFVIQIHESLSVLMGKNGRYCLRANSVHPSGLLFVIKEMLEIFFQQQKMSG